MENIFEGARFGDKFLTEFGIVIFVEKVQNHYLLLQEHTEFRNKKKNTAFLSYKEDGTAYCINRDWDIISKYQEPIDEEELADIKEAGYLTLWNKNKQNVEPGTETYTKDDIMEAIEFGYRKGVYK